MTVYATTDIAPGQEICIEYQSGFIEKTKAERSAQLQANFGFQCSCQLCQDDPTQVKASDARRTEIKGLVQVIADAGRQKDRPTVAASLDKLYGLLQEENYQAMPEFSNLEVSNAFALYASMKREAA